MTTRCTRVLGAAAVIVAAALLTVPSPAVAEGEAGAAESTSHLVSSSEKSDRLVEIEVYSPSMDRTIPLEVIRPADTSAPRPTLYLLNGAGGGEDSATWQRKTDVMEFFSDKNVNVVTPLEGALSYYTDWMNDDPAFGRQKWQTFMLDELPPVIDATFGTTGVQSISAISMTATSVLNYAIAKPGFYRSVGSYSGCAETTTPLGQEAVQMVVGLRPGVEIENMWGPVGGPGWVANDPVVNAEGLRGTELYITTGSGLPGSHDTLDGPNINGQVSTLGNQMLVGGVLEAATNHCTQNLANRLSELDIPATVVFRPAGTHSWGYWQDDLHNQWPLIARSLGV